jgi:hypothetical protein
MRFDPKSFLLGFAAFGLLVVLYLGANSVVAHDGPTKEGLALVPTVESDLAEPATETPTMGPHIVTPAATAPATNTPSLAVTPPAGCTPATAAEVQDTFGLIDAKMRDGTPAEKAIAENVRAQLDRNGDGKPDDGICHELIVEVNVKLALELPQ